MAIERRVLWLAVSGAFLIVVVTSAGLAIKRRSDAEDAAERARYDAAAAAERKRNDEDAARKRVAFEAESARAAARNHEIAAHNKLRQDILVSVQMLIKGFDCDCSASIDGDELVMDAPAGTCDRNSLVNLKKSLDAFDLDPSKAFESMRCSDDPAELRFR